MIIHSIHQKLNYAQHSAELYGSARIFIHVEKCV